MADSGQPDAMDGLLEHDGWLRQLARRLVSDPEVADDLAQDAVLIALKESEPPRSWRAWLGTVLRHLVHERRRRDQRRHDRERRSARPDREPSTLDLVEKVAAHREVVEVLMGLPDHYREVLLHRYYGQQTPTEIAASLEAPLSTVKTRLDRGLKRMRESLDERHGRSAWVLMLTPWIESAPVGPPIDGGLSTGAGVGAKVAAAFVAVACVVLSWSWLAPAAWKPWVQDDSASVAESEVRADRGAAEPGSVASLADGDGSRVGGAGSRLDATRDTAPTVRPVRAQAGLPDPPRPATGVVLGADGSRASGVLLRFEPDLAHPFAEPEESTGTAIALSQDGGRYRFPSLARPGRVVASSPWVTVLAGKVGWRDREDATVVAARARRLAGSVRDARQRPVPDARLRFTLADRFTRRIPIALDRSFASRWTGVTAADGSFEVSLPQGVELGLCVASPGYEPGTFEVDPDSSELALTLGSVAGSRIQGRVVDPDGLGLRGAVVSDGARVVHCGEQGDFVFLGASGPRTLHAVAPGWQATSVTTASTDGLQITLARPSRVLSGRVLDESGQPAVAMRVFLRDPTVLLDAPPPEALDGVTHWLYGAEDDFSPPVAESIALGVSRGSWVEVLSGEDGSFRIEGLGSRPYRVCVLDPATLVHEDFGPYEPGAEVTLRFRRERHRELAGVVVDRDGRPVPGVSIDLESTAMKLRRGEVDLRTRLICRDGTRSGPDGTFRLLRVPLEGTRLVLRHSALMPQRIEELGDGGSLTIRAWRRCRLRVQLGAGHRADRLQILDDADVAIALHHVRGDERRTAPEASLEGGSSEVLTVSDAARTAVLFEGERELQRIALQLVPGELTILR